MGKNKELLVCGLLLAQTAIFKEVENVPGSWEEGGYKRTIQIGEVPVEPGTRH